MTFSKKQIELDLTLQSLVGKEVKILNSNNKTEIGLSGTLIFETANQLHIKIKDEIKKILKKDLTIEFKYENETIELNCNQISNSLLYRLKKFK